MGIKKMEFAEFNQKVYEEQVEGLVLLGTGGDLKEWVDGVTGILHEEGIAKGNIFEQPILLTTTEGRQDMALIFIKGADIDLGKLAMWRIRFGDCSWISDYRVNYAEQHGFVPADVDFV